VGVSPRSYKLTPPPALVKKVLTDQKSYLDLIHELGMHPEDSQSELLRHGHWHPEHHDKLEDPVSFASYEVQLFFIFLMSLCVLSLFHF